MFSELLNRVDAQLVQELPFVVYRKPNSLGVKAILQKDDRLHHVTDFTEIGFVFAPFDDNNPSVLLRPDEQLEVTLKDETFLKHTIPDLGQGFDKGKEFHLNLVQKGIGQIKAGTFTKVVLSRKIEVECSKSPTKLFERILSLYPKAFSYLWYHPKIGMWLGATPEILLRTENNSLTTMSLAGTQAFDGSENPVWGRKELSEQQLVTDYISSALSGEVSQLEVSKVQSVRAGNLWHLRTKLTGKFKDNLSKIIKALHPTPAVCGMPLEASKKFVLKQEDYDREYYTGFLGELNLKQETDRTKNNGDQKDKSYRTIQSTTELFVNLRCAQLRKKIALIYVGGGITKASNPDKEWQETVAKSKTMLTIFSE